MENTYRPVIGITMGDPAGIGPEIICMALDRPEIYDSARPLVIGDVTVLKKASRAVNANVVPWIVETPEYGAYEHGRIDVIQAADIDVRQAGWGKPTIMTGRAMIGYIERAIDMAMTGAIDAVATCPVNKAAMKLAGSRFHGHTELFAARTNTDIYAMMMAGSRLKVVLVTIHMSLKDVSSALGADKIETVIFLTYQSLQERFGIKNPKIAVAGLNPHAGEEGMFGTEEKEIILPAVKNIADRGVRVTGPLPPDTVFYHAAQGAYDAVVCMYHDQGLIPFKMIHFSDGVNTTLGLPIIRTSVDHGTAYDIAGQGCADPGSLLAAVEMAAQQARCIRNASSEH